MRTDALNKLLLVLFVPILFFDESFACDLITENVENIMVVSKCDQVLKQYKEGLENGSPWAVKMFDATAKFQPDILSGNVESLGGFTQCLKIKAETNKGDAIFGKYCLGKFKFSWTPESKIQRDLTWGLCIPDACQADDVRLFFSDFLTNYTGGRKLDMRIESCQTYASVNPPFNAATIITITFMASILCLLVLSTLFDVYKEKFFGKGTYKGVLVAFSAKSNWNCLLRTNNSPEQLNCLCGLRVISMLWILFLHQGDYFSAAPLWDGDDFSLWLNSILDIFRQGAIFAVDTFLAVSGFLVAYTCTKKNQINLLKFYFHRYIRLAPALGMIILVSATLLDRFGSGPHWGVVVDNFEKPCQKYWWTTMLFIQNYANVDSMCTIHLWYLAVDMQLFMLSPILLYTFKSSTKFGYVVLSLLMVASVLVPFKIAWDLQLLAYPELFTDAFNLWLKNYYFVTHTRASPWLMGFFLAHLLAYSKKCPFKFEKIPNAIAWIVSFLILVTVIFSPYLVMDNTKNDLWTNALYTSLSRPLWTLAVCWIIYACAMGQGGPINAFLSLPAFQILSKLTYSLYLVHFCIIYVLGASNKTNVEFGAVILIGKFLSTFFLSLFVAITWVLCFEMPAVNLERNLFGMKQ